MGDLGEIPIAASFPGPKVKTVFCGFFWISSEVVGAKTEDDDFANFKLKVFARQENFISGDEGQYTLVVVGKLIFPMDPILWCHFPVNVGLRFSRKAATPSA